jgi:hypothetical protein
MKKFADPNASSRKSSCGDDTSSAASLYQPKNFLSSSLQQRIGEVIANGFEFGDDQAGLAFDSIPFMSSDGMYDAEESGIVPEGIGLV